MKFRSACILAFFLALTVFGCGSSPEPTGDSKDRSDVSPSKPPKTNAEELGLMIKLPYETEDIVWKDDAVKKSITAVLRFSPTDSNKIVAEALLAGTPEPAAIALQSWFPQELTAQSDMSGDKMLKGLAYPATPFYLAPYTVGKITRIEGSEYFILELSAK